MSRDILDLMKSHAASLDPNVEESLSCSQAAFKIRGKAFFYAGEQGGRFKTMFKLKESLVEAEKLAQQHPKDFQVGMWTTARFSADQPMPEPLWKKWLEESFRLST